MTDHAPLEPRAPLLRIRLGVMMFLQFFIWGAWYTTIAVYMRNNAMEDLTHWPYTVNPLAAIVAPFILGFVADRYVATEKMLAVLHVAGGFIMLFVPRATQAPVLFILLLLLYNLCYMATLGLVNSLAFHHVRERESEFPLIRVFGTVGWIAAGLFISFALSRFTASSLPEQTAVPLYTAGAAGLLFGLYCLSLPHTPPLERGQRASARRILGLDALRQLGSRPFYIFIISSLLVCIPLAAYYNFTQIFLEATGFRNIAGAQSLGQMSEVVFMLLMPLAFSRLGIKWMLLVGMFAWVCRYTLFAVAATNGAGWMIIAGILLHGICYDFFFVAGQIYMDKRSSPNMRGQAQGFLVLVTYGAGMLIGAQVSGNVYNGFLGGSAVLTMSQFGTFWLLPAAFAAGVMLFFAFSFRESATRENA
jgi:nucleoside transporter